MQIYPSGMIRRELAGMMPGGAICHTTWQRWRAAAGLTGNKATYSQWVKLCACYVLHRDGKPVTEISVALFVKKNGSDPAAFLPGLIPVGLPPQIPQRCEGRDLQDLLFQWAGISRTEQCIANWCESAGLEYSRGAVFGQSDILKILHQYAKCRQAKRFAGVRNLKKRRAAA